MTRPGIDRDLARSFGSGPHPPRPEARIGRASNDNEPCAHRCWSSALPEDAIALIEPWPTPTNQSGRARRRDWRLRFLPRTRALVDPFSGWIGGSDTLAQIELRFPSREAATLYCRRQGLCFEERS